MRALLVEADPAVRSHLHTTLNQRGWRVTVACGYGEALRSFRAAPVPLIIVSRQLEDGDGLDLCRAIRASTLGRAAYVLVTLPSGVPEAARPLVEAGADDFLTTPLLPALLAMRLSFAECRLALHPAEPHGDGRVSSYPERIAELEHELRVQQASLGELVESAPEGITVVDEDDRVVRINGEFSRMFGYSAEEVLGRPINELIVPDQLREQGSWITRSVVGGERVMLETLRRRRDGSLIDVSLLATPIRVGDGSIGAYGIYRDITERKIQERALAESEARYRALFEQAPVGVFLCDMELRITHCNQRLTQITGAAYEQIVGAPLRERGADALLPGLQDALPDRPAFYAGIYQSPGAAEHRWIAVRYAPLRDAGGSVIGGMGVVEDVTQRERAQQQLRAQAAELERVNAALRERTLELEAAIQVRSRLYTSMNHELRTPISAIMLYQELLLTGALGELSREQLEALEHSHGAAQHLLELVRDVLDLSRIEAGKMVLSPAEIDLRGLARDLLSTVLPLAQHHGSELRLEIDDDLPALTSDPQRVRQILLNLISNAAKYGRARPIVIRCRTTGAGEVCIEVEDQGIGIAAADLQQVFEDFVQVGGAREGGTGLGLAISRRLATLLSGRLEVESELDVGSTFRLVLPLVPGAEPLTQEQK